MQLFSRQDSKGTKSKRSKAQKKLDKFSIEPHGFL